MKRDATVYLALTAALFCFGGTARAGDPGAPVEILEAGHQTTGIARSIGMSEATAVVELYQQLMDRFQGSGYDLRFELSDFKTITPAEFDRLSASAVVTPPVGRRLELVLTEYSDARGAAPKVHFEPRWVDSHHEDLTSSLLSPTVREALLLDAEQGAWNPELVESLTSYSVRVELDGEERTYRAAVLWARPAEQHEVALWVLDNISPGAEIAATVSSETTSARSFEEVELDAPRLNPITGNLGPTGSYCSDDNWDRMKSQFSAVGTAGHQSGVHSTAMQLKGRCECSADCIASCSPDLVVSNCQEFGTVPWVYHVKSQIVKVEGDQATNQATCVGGVGCMIKSCLSPFCAAVKITALVKKGIGVTFSPDQPVLWDGSLSDKATCICDVIYQAPTCV